MSDIILQTDRLQVRPLTEGDFDNLLDLHSDPEVNRYLSCGPVPMSAEEVRTRLDRYLLTNKTDGLGKWKVETREGEFLGRAGFDWQDDPAGWELGYSFKQTAWGKGYATEIARGLIAWFFKHTQHNYLIAYAVSEHHKSLNIMKKAGLTFWQDRHVDGEDLTFYRLERADFEAPKKKGSHLGSLHDHHVKA
ncbi:acetyltransferase, gnat family [Roseibium sp. TrichSKD4]|uniref:GNAT family N-acetyltransferase n=1 Tax=Roseibium sp. TrichSKD4 TaxID=744980 RepID=UPI0001E5767B|nr:GNAT family N-acetyltransferase [Roseibium sp. TrichSKD4]EFO30989.1 acetyltransferase, gnat family [Roseibium sp. TrichSKD4]